LILYLSKIQSNKLNIESCEKFKKEAFSGKIENKFIDKKEHNYRMLIISKNNGSDSSFYNSGFWDFVQTNDSIVKKGDSFEIYIVNKDTTIILNYDDCK
jgi:hypothetical protein